MFEINIQELKKRLSKNYIMSVDKDFYLNKRNGQLAWKIRRKDKSESWPTFFFPRLPLSLYFNF